ncbi:hypothetical protein ACP275_10G116200 [Erythranthe tilingii]
MKFLIFISVLCTFKKALSYTTPKITIAGQLKKLRTSRPTQPPPPLRRPPRHPPSRPPPPPPPPPSPVGSMNFNPSYFRANFPFSEEIAGEFTDFPRKYMN